MSADETTGFDLFAEWSARSPKDIPELTAAKWESLRAPYAVGWDYISRLAREQGTFNAAAMDFEPVVGDSATPATPEGPDTVDNMFRRYAWVEGAKRAVDLATGELLDQEQFEFRVPPLVVERPAQKEGGKPTKVKTSAWKVFKDHGKHRKSYKNLTCRFGEGLEVVENLPDLEGLCLNVWRDPHAGRGKTGGPRALPDKVTDSDVDPFLRLAAHVVPNDDERAHVFDFMAFTAQRPNEKINHALVLGSRTEGIGKDTLLEPLRAAIGRKYVREIQPQALSGSFNKWMVGCKLVLVQEMHNFERRATMNLLKPLVAAPPDALSVNLKGVQEFFVPNLLSTVFFTNEDDALAISNGDRRYFITWNDGPPMPKAFYDEVWDWLRAGGTEKAVRWLLSRDISRFNAKGRAPDTAAKENMRQQSRAPLQEWVEEGVAAGDFPFDRDLVLAEDVLHSTPEYARFKSQFPSPHRIGKVLAKAGAVVVSEKLRIPNIEGSRRIWALRRTEMYVGLDPDKLRELFLQQRQAAENRALT